MKLLLTLLIILLTFLSFSQNVIEISISKIGVFAKYGKDSLHLMIAKSECSHYTKNYDMVNLKLVINKSQKKVYRFKDNLPQDTLPIKKIEFKDSIYTITVSELCNPMYAEFEGQMIDCYLVLDVRKNPINKKVPTFTYFWVYKFILNEEFVESAHGRVSDYVTINY